MVHNPNKRVRILLIEDSEHDAVSFKRALNNADFKASIYHFVRAEEALTWMKNEKNNADLFVSDYKLPGISGLEFFTELQRLSVSSPFIVLTGAGSEHLAVDALRAGVDDYIVKDSGQHYLELLPLVINGALKRYSDQQERIRVEEEKEILIKELREALDNIKTLSGLIPICSSCKKVRDDSGFWSQVEDYVARYSGAEFSHSICPDCIKQLYPEYYNRKYTISNDE